MSGMEFHQLRYFLAVAKTGSIREASAQCHVSQPALSEQIQKLESEMEAPLFHRNYRGVTLTDAGRVLAERSAHILDQIEGTKRAVQSQMGTRERIQIGTIPTIAPYLLPPALARFRQEFPSPQLNVREELSPRMLRMLEDGELELGIVSLPINEQSFVVEELFTEELLLAVPVRHPLEAKPVVQIEDLLSEKFILMNDEHCLCGQILAFCQRNGFRPQIAFRSSQLEAVQSFVMAGEGIAFIPRMAKCRGPLAYRSVENGPTRTIISIRRNKAQSTDSLNTFLNLLRLLQKSGLIRPVD